MGSGRPIQSGRPLQRSRLHFAAWPAILTLSFLLPCTACAQVWFEEVTEAAGIEALISQNKPAGGIGVADFNRNGFPDLFMVGFFEPNRLYFNRGDGTFEEDPVIAAQIALTDSTCNGVAVADFDNDGWPDVYLVCDGNNHLLHNLEGQGFANVITPTLNHPERTEAASWADLTGNGLLDLVIGAHPRSSPPDPNDPANYDRILLNLGDGEFMDIAPNLEISQPLGTTLALKIADIDGDGKPDIYIVNDRHDGNVLLLNRGPGCNGWCFDDVSDQTGADRSAYGMGIAIADFDRDGDWDLFYTSIFEQVLLRNLKIQTGKLEFVDHHHAAGIDIPYYGWGTVYIDADNDGWEDLVVAFAVPVSHGYDRLFHNQKDGTFVDLHTVSGLHVARASESVARLDYERNGRQDLIFSHNNQRYRLYRNTAPAPGNWIGFRLEGGGAINRDAIGTLIRLETADGGLQMRERRAGGSRGATHDPALHFGLGEFDQAQVRVHWPCGLLDDRGVLESGRYHHLVYPPVENIFGDEFR